MNFKLETMLEIKELLETEGYLNDEQCNLGSPTFERQQDEIREDLAELGYFKSIRFGGGYFPNIGALYWIFDTEIVRYEKAKKLSNEWAGKF